MKAFVDEETCIGCGICEDICPAVFKMGDNSKAHVITEDCSAGCCEEAKDSCPTGSISLKD